jgi:hypothetical protein
MGNILYIIAIILIILWETGLLVYQAGASIHILLIFAIVILIPRALRKA